MKKIYKQTGAGKHNHGPKKHILRDLHKNLVVDLNIASRHAPEQFILRSWDERGHRVFRTLANFRQPVFKAGFPVEDFDLLFLSITIRYNVSFVKISEKRLYFITRQLLKYFYYRILKDFKRNVDTPHLLPLLFHVVY